MKSKLIKKESLRQPRVFSDQVKRQIVKDIESGKCSVKQARDELLVSYTSVYKWIGIYSRYLHQNKRLVVENKSEAYHTKQMLKRIQELEAALGRKQMELDLMAKIIDLANAEYKADLKKNFSKTVSNGFDSPKDPDTTTK